MSMQLKNCFGTSLGMGIGTAYAQFQAYPSVLRAYYGLPIVNYCHGGDCIPDACNLVHQITPQSGDINSFELGTNDQWWYKPNPSVLAAAMCGMAEEIFYLGIPHGTKILPINMAQSGTWVSPGATQPFSLLTNTTGSTLVFPFHGDWLALATTLQAGQFGAFTITVDGNVIAGPISVNSAASTASAHGIDTMPRLGIWSIPPIAGGEHLCIISIPSGSGPGNDVIIHWAAGLTEGPPKADSPIVVVPTLHYWAPSVSDTPTWNSFTIADTQDWNAQVMLTMGLANRFGVHAIPVSAETIVKQSDLFGDGIHWLPSGNYNVAMDGYVPAIAARGTPFATAFPEVAAAAAALNPTTFLP